MMHRPLSYVAPIGSLAVLTLIAALPWGLPSDNRFFLPLLPVVAIHYWSLRHGALIPEWGVFLAGLVLDILTLGPLGYWALIYLAAHMIALVSAPLASRGPASRLVLFGLALISVAATAWVVSSVYALEPVDVGPYVIGVVYAGLVALCLVPILRAIDVQHGSIGNLRLERGG